MKPFELSTFPKSDQEKWLEIAKKQLKGDDPLQKFAWNTCGLTNLKPYYDTYDTKDLDYLINFFQTIPSHRWRFYEKIQVTNEMEANKQALAALGGGCDGVILELEDDFNQDILFKGIDLSLYDVSLSGLNGVIKATGEVDPTNCVYQDASVTVPFDQVRSLLEAIDMSIECVHRKAFSDFFLEIAAVRALRFMLNTEKRRNDIRIHTSIPPHKLAENQWFLNTTSGLASILGGSYSIDMPTATGHHRITRNIGNLIREESGIEVYKDPCGGSYLIESLTHQIIQHIK
ncbi:MAG: methylmalonyl-CoA mutase family protein [Bacteroidota bacterium]